MPTNFYMLFVAALIPMVVGAFYYHEKTVGGAWMKANGFTPEYIQAGNPAMAMLKAYLLMIPVAFLLSGMVVHQVNFVQLMIPEVLEAGGIQQEVSGFLSKYGDRHRTFPHGAFHGALVAIGFVLPIIGINATFERRGLKYILIHGGYWLLSLSLMGGLLCATLKYSPI